MKNWWIWAGLAVGGIILMKSDDVIGSTKDIFPDNLDKLLRAAANKYRIDVFTLKAIAANESMVGKYTSLEKIGGTTGVMHIKLATAQQFNKKLTAAELARPEIDIEYGARYFRWLMDRYSHYDKATQTKFAVIAYNGGPGRADQIVKSGEAPFKNETWFKNVTTYFDRYQKHYSALITA